LAIWSAISLRSLEKLRQNFFAGSQGQNLEKTLNSISQDLKDSKQQQELIKGHMERLYDELGFAVQKVGMLRFNPFADGGGNFSFCLALLDSHNSGVIITSLHGREQNRIYAKKISKGKAESKLTDEENQAIALANTKP
jgi:hypothetical protein